MHTFRIRQLADSESRVDKLVDAMDSYDLAPDYQRQADLWSEEKKQLFIDSLINEYDVPKLYFHRTIDKTKHGPKYAIVDGKQRLETIRQFLRDDFPLSDDFTDAQAGINLDAAAGKHYSDLTKEHPSLATRLTHYVLDIVVIETDDEEVIEELFSRLNEAVPLNAPEKRNALGGAMPPIIRRIVRTSLFFTNRLPIENRRYKHYDLVTKFLYLADRGTFASTKKRALDDFVKSFKDSSGKPKERAKARKLSKTVTATLSRMVATFEEQDELLTSIGLVTVYYMAFLLSSGDEKLAKRLDRKHLLEFDHVRRHNRFILRKEQQAIASGRPPTKTRVRRDLAIFDRLMQSPNDGQALEYRYQILMTSLQNKEFRDALPKELRRRMGDEPA
jgi:hypothetical protein